MSRRPLPSRSAMSPAPRGTTPVSYTHLDVYKRQVLYHAELATALARLPEQAQEEIFRYYFLRQPQRVIGVHIGRTRSTAGRHIRLALQRLRRLMEGNDYE